MEHGGCLLVSGDHGDDHQLELPPGFRFHPTDEELITHYLSRKVADGSFVAKAIAEIDFNKIEPWDLPWRAKMGEKEWYFFAVPDRKYPTGLRTNRATDAGYWKATGKDKEIHRGSNLVGMKKTLVFYRGRAPKGEKTNWVMHEYRLHGKRSLYNLPETAKNEWVICRVFQKSCLAASSGGCGGDGKKVAGLVRIGSSSYGDETMMVGGADGSSSLSAPPWMDTEQFGGGTAGKAVRAISGAAHVTCFSNPMEEGQTGYLAGDPLFSAGYADPSPSSLVPSTWPLLLDNYSTLSEPDGAGRLTSSCLRLWSGAGNGMMQLPQSQHGYGVIKKGCTKVEVDVGGCSLSQETGLTTDMNPEISSSVLCKPQVQKLVGLFDGQEVPLTSASSGNVVNAPPDGGIWNY